MVDGYSVSLGLPELRQEIVKKLKRDNNIDASISQIIVTVGAIEGLAAADGTLHPIQKSFVENGGIQCGFCSPGMIMSAKALLDKTPSAPEKEIKEVIAGNLCRCTGYVQIIDSIKAVSGHGEDEPQVVAFKTDEKDRGE